jgi:membrane-bound lytic murein transglycosylase B
MTFFASSIRIGVVFILAVGVVLGSFPWAASAETEIERRARLQAELTALEKEIQSLSVFKVEKSRERTSLERDIAILDAQIEAAQLSIRHRDLTIRQIQSEISDKQQAIAELDAKLVRSQESLAQILRRTREIDDVSLVEQVLKGSLSDFFEDIDNYEAVQDSLDQSFQEIALVKDELNGHRAALQNQHEEEAGLRQIQVLEKEKIEAQEDQKQEILSVTKGEEAKYQELISTRERTAAQIRAELFGLRDSGSIPFGTAYEYAKAASAATGVRPAFILAILKQETDLGKNVGTCNRAGDPPEKSWQNIMPGPTSNSSRDDQTVFLALMAQLGRDPNNTPLSCPWGNGWGGAMGPSQFIPTTWKAYAPRVAAALGVPVADPWNARHAFFATAIYMQDLGAAAQTYTAERTAALKYYAGGGWNKPANAFYGNSVMDHAADFQADIDILQGS